ncbi:MAG TPA: hydroxymethylbilane synthase [Acidimicrobiales bacterium]|nr:hydroxymethylbilane synthase [Acidimicrobiales bacterium]
MGSLRVATRGSPLALRQAELVAEALMSAGTIATELVVIETSGDVHRDRPIGAIGGQGAFVKEVEQALLEGRADLAVHSAKDLPSSFGTYGLGIVAVLRRADPRDALVGRTLDQLGPGAHVATGAARRRAQLAWLRPDLRFEELRGNIATRLAKVPAGGAVVAAYAALERLGLSELAAEVLPTSTMLPQVGQGALAVQCRLDDKATTEAARLIDDAGSHRCLDAERAFLRELGGGCDLPVGAHGVLGPGGEVDLEGLIASSDGLVLLRRKMSGRDPFTLGRELAREIRDRCGGAEILFGTAGMP